MEERTIIKSEQEGGTVFLAGGAILSVLVGFFEIMIHYSGWDWIGGTLGLFWWEGLLVAIVVFIVVFVFYRMFKACELTVSNKRIYGKGFWGKRVDLPLDSVSAVGTSLFKGISITSASGAIKFAMISNRDEIHDVISRLLVERQSKPIAQTTIKQEIPQSNADELAKYKDLLDKGIITKEEFDAKKKQLLGL